MAITGEKNKKYKRAVLRLPTLYYYNEADEDLEFVCYDMVRENGDTDFLFTHASEYVAVMSDEMEEPISTTELQEKVEKGEVLGTRAVTGAGTVQEAAAMDMGSVYAIIGFVVLAGAGTCIYIYKKKRGIIQQL